MLIDFDKIYSSQEIENFDRCFCSGQLTRDIFRGSLKLLVCDKCHCSIEFSYSKLIRFSFFRNFYEICLNKKEIIFNKLKSMNLGPGKVLPLSLKPFEFNNLLTILEKYLILL